MPNERVPVAELTEFYIKEGIKKVTPEQVILVYEATAELPKSVRHVQNILQKSDELAAQATLAGEFFFASGNVLLSVGGGSICLMSGKNFIQSNNKIAKVFYALGFMCGTTGTVSSTMAVYCNKCGISKTGMLSDGFGTLFLKAGDQANRWGKRLEGNITPQPSRFSRFLPRQHSRKPLNTVVGHKGLSFVPTCQTEIPVMELIAIGGTIYTVYRTTRLGLHYSRKLYAFIKSNSKIKRDGSPSIRLVSEFFIETLQIDKILKIYKIYYVALTL